MKSSTDIKYIHEISTHNLVSPEIIVPVLIELFNPKSVIDIGCGIGTFLYQFKKLGVNEVLGLDGDWVSKKKLLINQQEFVETDLEKPINLVKTFDLVLCLEVAEHLSENAADVIVNSLVNLGKIIVFSAATTKQGGQNHLNEQPFEYWKVKFEEKGYSVIDFFRPIFWNNKKIQWWYKQNMFLIVHNSVDINNLKNQAQPFSENELLIHPELYYERVLDMENKSKELEKLREGNGGNINFYIGLLFKKIAKKFSFGKFK